MKFTNNKKIIGLAFSFLSLFFVTRAQTLQWTKHYQTNSAGDGAYDVHVGGDDRIYVCGYTGVVDTSAQGNAMIISYTASGTQNWVSTYTPAFSEFDAMTTYGTGSSISIYATGLTYSLGLGGDVLVAKYNQSGVQQWAAVWNGDIQSIPKCISVDGSGNVYVCGRINSNGNDVFVLKYNSSGTLQWSTTYNSSGTQDDTPQYMKINAAGTSLYITSITSVSSTNHNAVLQKVNTSTGAITWTAVWDNTLTNDIDETYWIDLDNDENIYVAGEAQTASNAYDALVLIYNSSGTLQAANTWNNSAHNLNDVLYSINVTQLTHTPMIYVTGYTGINLANNDADYLTMKFTGTNSTPAWVSTYDGAGTGCLMANDDVANMVLVDAATAKVFVTGWTWEPSASHNMTTVKYNAGTGAQEWASSYDRGGVENLNAFKYPMDIHYDGCYFADQVYVTGYTHEGILSTPYDATTVKYGYAGMCMKMANPNLQPGEELPLSNAIVYPNPFNSTAVFESAREDIQDASFIIYDMTGREVKRIENIIVSRFEFDSKELGSGLYFYRFIQNNELLSSGKFGVEK